MRKKLNIRPLINLFEKSDEYVFYVTCPGLQRQDYDVQLKPGSLTISVKGKINLGYLEPITQKPLKPWRKKIRLPEDADTLMTAAEFRDGGLNIHIPKGAPIDPLQLTDTQVYIY